MNVDYLKEVCQNYKGIYKLDDEVYIFMLRTGCDIVGEIYNVFQYKSGIIVLIRTTGYYSEELGVHLEKPCLYHIRLDDIVGIISRLEH